MVEATFFYCMLLATTTASFVPAGSIATRGAAGFEHFRIDQQLYMVSVSSDKPVFSLLLLIIQLT